VLPLLLCSILDDDIDLSPDQIELKRRYEAITNKQAWMSIERLSSGLQLMTSDIYDNNICDPYFCLQKQVYRERAGLEPDFKMNFPDLPWVLAFVKAPTNGYPDEP
jgi:hypothetical protein